LKQIVVIDVDDGNQYVLINPEIVASEGSQTGYEGCLSLPGKSGIVRRPEYVKTVAFDADMNPIEVEGHGLFARAMCHEFDHLDGHLYLEKVEGPLNEVSYADEDEN
ncbi:MAG: peptide deformylase, partial [Coprococcus catus]|nr:peptide deformylase [Coprococcus catus]